MSKIAFFDFDGTITQKDTLWVFLLWRFGVLQVLAGVVVNAPWLAGYTLRLVRNDQAKERLLGYFLKHMPVNAFNEACRRFAQDCIPQLVRPGAHAEINRLKGEGYQIVVVSASPENWVGPWAGAQGLEVLATRLQVHNGQLTGKFEGKNCHGREKVHRIQQAYPTAAYTHIVAYGDSSGDRPMMALRQPGYYKPFRN